MLPKRDGVLVPDAPAAGVDAGAGGFAPKRPLPPVAPPPNIPPPVAPVPVVPGATLVFVFPNRLPPVVPPPLNSPPVAVSVAGAVEVLVVPNNPPPGAGAAEGVEDDPKIFVPDAGVVVAGRLEPKRDPPTAGVVVLVWPNRPPPEAGVVVDVFVEPNGFPVGFAVSKLFRHVLKLRSAATYLQRLSHRIRLHQLSLSALSVHPAAGPEIRHPWNSLSSCYCSPVLRTIRRNSWRCQWREGRERRTKSVGTAATCSSAATRTLEVT